MNNHQEYNSNRLRFELKPKQLSKLKQIAEHYGQQNLQHQLNLLLDSLWKALELDKKEGN